MRNTKILRSLTFRELEQLKKFLDYDKSIWEPHLPKTHIHLTELKQGTSIHIQMLDNQLNEIELLSKKNLFLDFYNILIELCNGKKLGRAYIHKLSPNTCVEKHHDLNLPYIKYVGKRMHFYLDIPDKCILLLDNKIQNTENFKYKYIDFAWEHEHYYYNGSNEDWIFCVFDILKD